MLLSVIIPIYNEEDNLEKNIKFHIKCLSFLKNKFELILINDGSTDNTQQIIDKICKKSKIKIKKKKICYRSGVGMAIFEGIKLSEGKYIFHNSCDLAYQYENFKDVISKLEKYDLIIIERYDRSSNSFWRKVTSFTWNLIVKIILKLPFDDLNFVQFYKKKYINDISFISKSSATLTVCLINYFYKKNYKIIKMKSIFHKRLFNKSSYGNLSDIILNFFSLISIKINESKNFKR